MALRAVSISKEIYNKPVDAPEEIRQVGKVKIKLFLPPTDIPKFVSSEFNRKTDTFKIKFAYSLPEKRVYLFSNKQASLLIGEQSGKPLVIEVRNIRKNKIDEIHLLTNYIRGELERLIAVHLDRIKSIRQRANVERAQEVLQKYAPELAEVIA